LGNALTGVLMSVRQHTAAWPFLKPVNPLEVPDYYDHIKYPMDLKSMGDRLKKGLVHDERSCNPKTWRYHCFHQFQLLRNQKIVYGRYGQNIFELSFV
jgi:hypothetical protein